MTANLLNLLSSVKNCIFVKLKKVNAILICLLYLLSSVGVSAKAHYCGDYLAGLAFNNPHQEIGCGCSTSIESESCCKEIDVDYKVETDHSASNSLSLKSVVAATIAINQPFDGLSLYSSSLEGKLAVPSFKEPPSRLLFCIFLC